MVHAKWWMAVITVTVSCSLVACTSPSSTSSSVGGVGVSSSSTEATVTTTTAVPSSTITSTTSGSSTTSDSRGSPTSTSTSVPVEVVPGPPAGSMWGVVGVAHDDRLNVRSGPGVGSAIVGSLDPTANEVVAAGHAAAVGSAVWWQVSAAGLDGWVNAFYLGALGDTDDVAWRVVDLVGAVPSAASMGELAAIVTSVMSEGAEGARTVVVAPADDVSDIGEITVDLFVDGDDAIRGERLVVFGQRIEQGGDYALYAVESTPICWRGVEASGLCV